MINPRYSITFGLDPEVTPLQRIILLYEGKKKNPTLMKRGFLNLACWPTRTRTLNETTKMSCVTITPSANTVLVGAKVIRNFKLSSIFEKKF